MANTYGYGNLPLFGVPNAMTADGPAGLRIKPEVGVKTTAFREKIREYAADVAEC